MNAKQELNDLIATHGSTMTREQHERALNLWRDGVVNRKDVAAELTSLKAEVTRPDLSPLQRLHVAARQTPQRLNGFQQAAVKAGLPPDTPGIEGMSFQQMKDLAAQKQDAAYEPLRQKHAGLHRHGLPVGRQGTLEGGYKP